MPRRTKIVATLGPATDDRKILKKVLAAGVNVVRLNFSHGIPQDHIDLSLIHISEPTRPY